MPSSRVLQLLRRKLSLPQLLLLLLILMLVQMASLLLLQRRMPRQYPSVVLNTGASQWYRQLSLLLQRLLFLQIMLFPQTALLQQRPWQHPLLVLSERVQQRPRHKLSLTQLLLLLKIPVPVQTALLPLLQLLRRCLEGVLNSHARKSCRQMLLPSQIPILPRTMLLSQTGLLPQLLRRSPPKVPNIRALQLPRYRMSLLQVLLPLQIPIHVQIASPLLLQRTTLR